MTTSHPHQRVGIFIDVQNVYHSAKNLHHARVNFRELIRMLADGRPVIRAMAYVVKSDAVPGEESFFEALRQAGLELRLKDLQVNADGSKKADWDVGMAVDAVRMANFLDVVILVTGDGDFGPLIEYLKWGLGRQVEVAAFSHSTSGKLRELADRFTEIEKIPRLLMKIRPPSASEKKSFDGGRR